MGPIFISKSYYNRHILHAHSFEIFRVVEINVQYIGSFMNLYKFQGKATRFTTTWPAFKNPFALFDVNNLMRDMDKLMEEVSKIQFCRVHLVLSYEIPLFKL